MSNYGSTYNISQTGNLYTLEAHGAKTGLSKYAGAKGTTVNSPVNYRFLKLFRGFDNEFFMFVKNQDRKPIKLQGMQINASFIDRRDRSTVVSKRCIITDYELGSIKVVVTSGESARFGQGHYDLVFSYTNDLGHTMPMFCDLHMRPNYTVEVNEEGDALPLTTEINDEFLERAGTDDNGNSVTYYYSSQMKSTGYFDKPNGLITLAVYGTNYTGTFYAQGTLSDSPSESDWFDITLGQYTDTFYPYNNFTGVDPWSFRTNVKFIRTIHTVEQGSLDKVVIRV